MGSRKFGDKLNIVSKNIIKYRKEKKISQAKLAEKLQLMGINMFSSDIYTIENEKRTVKDYELIGIATALGIKMEDLYEDNEELKILYKKTNGIIEK